VGVCLEKQQRRGRRRSLLPSQSWASVEEEAASRSASRPAPLSVVGVCLEKQQRRGRRRQSWASVKEAAASRSASRPAPLAVVGVC
jgi:hypothetical protein